MSAWEEEEEEGEEAEVHTNRESEHPCCTFFSVSAWSDVNSPAAAGRQLLKEHSAVCSSMGHQLLKLKSAQFDLLGFAALWFLLLILERDTKWTLFFYFTFPQIWTFQQFSFCFQAFQLVRRNDVALVEQFCSLLVICCSSWRLLLCSTLLAFMFTHHFYHHHIMIMWGICGSFIQYGGTWSIRFIPLTETKSGT